MPREEMVAVIRAHQVRRGIRDGRVHCSCGWVSGPDATYLTHFVDAVYAVVTKQEGTAAE